MLMKLRRLVVSANTTAISAELPGWPWSGIVICQIDATVVPWIAVGVEASGRLDGNQRGLGDIARAQLE
jgi:hypothetical protein